MAGPIAHLYCALALLSSGALTVENEQAFLIGTVFPDIRYTGAISRQQTHRKFVKWEHVLQAESSFEKGVILHSLVDQVRIVKLEQPLLKKMKFLPIMRSQMLKFYEDNLLYDRIKIWPIVSDYFDEVLPEEKQQNIPVKAISTWHRFIKAYCSQKPSVLNLNNIIMQFPELRGSMPVELASLASKAYAGISFATFKKSRMAQPITGFYDNAVNLITSNAHFAYTGVFMDSANYA